MLKIKTWIRKSAQWLINLIVKSSLKITVKGKKNIPKTAQALVIANHSSYLDVPILGHALFNNLFNLTWVISKYNYHLWYLKWLYFVFNVIVVNGTIEKVKKDLSLGHWPVIFPEGGKRWCPPRQAKKKKPGKGAAVIALTTGVTIIPIGIKGADKVLPARSFRYNPRRRITVSIGESFSFNMIGEEKIDDKLLEKTTAEMIQRIYSLV